MKAQIAVSRHDDADLRTVLRLDFGLQRVSSLTPLMGGFSGTNYLVACDPREAADDEPRPCRRFVLKFCNGYDVQWVDSQVRAQALLLEQGFSGLCSAIPMRASAAGRSENAGGSCATPAPEADSARGELLAPAAAATATIAAAAAAAAAVDDADANADDDTANADDDSAGRTAAAASPFVSTRLGGVPAVLLSFVGGRNASHVCHDRADLAENVLREVGGGLAAMHLAGASASAKALEAQRSFRNSGCCNLFEHLDGSFLQQLESSEHTANHEFVI